MHRPRTSLSADVKHPASVGVSEARATSKMDARFSTLAGRTETGVVTVKPMRLRYAGTCACGIAVAAGTHAGYDSAAKRAVCPGCLSERLAEAGPTAAPRTDIPARAEGVADASPDAPPAAAPGSGPDEPDGAGSPAPRQVSSGTAGGSARAEYERRTAKREARIRAAHPRLGGLILALSDDPQTTRAWASGAAGERAIGAKLDGLAGDAVLTLHDRRIPGTRANIDHIAIGPSGVFVIDAKRYNDAKVEIRSSGGWFSERIDRLFVAGRDRTKLVTGLAPQVAAVYEALEDQADLADVVVQPVLAFVDALLPVITSLEIAGVPVLGPRKTAKLVRRDGPLTLEQRSRLHHVLAEKLPAYQRS